MIFLRRIKLLLLFSSIVSCTYYNKEASKSDISIQTIQENNTDDTVVIGDQIWMKKNLDVCVFRNGDSIFHAKTYEEWVFAAKNQIPAWCYYNNNMTNQISNIEEFAQSLVEFSKEKYRHEEALNDTNIELTVEKVREIYENYNKSIADCRKLYNWYAVNDYRGLAPEGWSIPTKDDFEKLKKYYGNPWRKNFTLEFIDRNWRGVNADGFSACPCGRRLYNGNFEGLLNEAVFWTRTSKDNNNAFAFAVFSIGGGGGAGDDYSNGVITDYYGNKGNGFSVRCIKNKIN